MKQLSKLLLLTVGMLMLVACGRETIKGTGDAVQETRDLAEFSGLDVSGNYEILGSPGSPEKFVIASNSNILPYIETKVKSGVVSVIGKSSKDLEPTVTQKIWFTVPKFSTLTLNGSSIFQFQNLAGDDLKISLSGSHQLLLSGKATSLDLTVSGSSDVDARALNLDTAKIVISGSGTVYVNPAKTLNVVINGQGRVIYFSENPKVEQVINGTGQVSSNFGKLSKDAPQPDQKY